MTKKFKEIVSNYNTAIYISIYKNISKLFVVGSTIWMNKVHLKYNWVEQSTSEAQTERTKFIWSTIGNNKVYLNKLHLKYSLEISFL